MIAFLDHFKGYVGFVIAGATILLGLCVIAGKIVYDRLYPKPQPATKLADLIDVQSLDGFSGPPK